MNFNLIQINTSGPEPVLPSLTYVECPFQQIKKRPNKVQTNCKKAHLACDVSRPCNRCVTTDKADSCHDIQHKKRGRPKMMRDANNNKIRPVSTTTTPPLLSVFPNASSNDMMTIFLSMDLCCARVSDKSLACLELYPQEFGQRSLYDILLPEENHQHCLSKLHRCLLDNAVQHQPLRLPHDLIRSSSEKFFASSLDNLLTIANGSLTLKQKLTFRSGRRRHDFEEMNCRFYLGGGFGADLFDASTLGQLYIVCIASPVVSAMNMSDMTHLTPLMMMNTRHSNDDPCPTAASPVSPATAFINVLSSSDQTKQPEKNEQDDSGSSTPVLANNTFQLPFIISNQQPSLDSNSKSVLDRLHYNTKPPSQQFIHPNELYYLQTTSSRLSSEAIAHTAYPYLSNPYASVTAVGSGPLAHYNSHFKK